MSRLRRDSPPRRNARPPLRAESWQSKLCASAGLAVLIALGVVYESVLLVYGALGNVLKPRRTPDHNHSHGTPEPPGIPRSSYRVLCVDDSEAVCGVVARAVKQQTDMELAGVLADAEQLLIEVKLRGATVVVLDLYLHGVTSLPALRALKVALPECAVVVYSGYDDPERVNAAMEAGASKFVPKRDDFDALLAAIRSLPGKDV